VGRTAYGFGGDPELLPRFGWFDKNSGQRRHVGRERTPGLRGLWDMHGNVFEWVHDFYGEWTSATAIDPTGPKIYGPRVIRGGCCYSYARLVRCASRYHISADFENDDLSFRLVRVPRS
ncbi:MAG: formylglycine-generating enzyme family protein, partial [Planctomycetaceae bacterium]